MEHTVTLDNVQLSDIHERPELITSLLYKKLIQKLDEAILLISQQKFIDANKALQLCNDIVTRLGFGIKYEAGVIADQFEQLYRYMFERLYEANLKKDIEILQEVYGIVKEIDEAWSQAMNAVSTGVHSIHQENLNMSDVARTKGTSSRLPRLNPYQQREIQQEIYEYEKENQEVHLKK
jgi:flagellar protein FliS